MPRSGKRKRMGWFGWSMTALGVTLVVAIAFFSFVFDLGGIGLFNDQQTETSEQQTDESSGSGQSQEELEEKAEETRESVGKEYEDVGDFVAETHDFYNDTTGYGRIDNLDWSEQETEAEEIITVLDDMLPKVEDDALKSDLEKIQQLATSAVEDDDKKTIRSLHRMFHDLDIALNDYQGTDKIWGVTNTLK
ncbi:hypothetical protein [Sediminibacillus halophilus]|uniref:Uncharacterized protein n=1 Tax=Sediminibacillus halophilus TaxID=482461 RepID=A0A1G9NWJ4_9BACI|nr:hypothetical protein [Sediminibacillus halophilus]SDL90948.1 hypothetical protein SAMN05216244_1187 [Sediminibacillus halophilus]